MEKQSIATSMEPPALLQQRRSRVRPCRRPMAGPYCCARVFIWTSIMHGRAFELEWCSRRVVRTCMYSCILPYAFYKLRSVVCMLEKKKANNRSHGKVETNKQIRSLTYTPSLPRKRPPRATHSLPLLLHPRSGKWIGVIC